MQSMYLGISPFEAPAVYTLLPYTELAEDGLYYPEGGIYALPTAMAAVARKLGVDIQTGRNVTQIMVKDGRARGVCVDGEMLPADIVISNADLPYTYTDLLAERPAKYEEASWRKQAFTSSAFMLYLGTDRVYPELQHHNFFLSSDYKRNFEEIFDAKVPPRDPSFYVNCPGRTDPTVAPPGGDNLFVLVPIPHLTEQQPWDDGAGRPLQGQGLRAAGGAGADRSAQARRRGAGRDAARVAGAVQSQIRRGVRAVARHLAGRLLPALQQSARHVAVCTSSARAPCRGPACRWSAWARNW